MRKLVIWVFVAYIAFLHVFSAIAVLKTDVVERILIRLGVVEAAEQESIFAAREVHRQMDSSVPEGATVFLGDSNIQALITAAIVPRSVNFGIGGQRSDQLLESLPIYQSLQRSAGVIVMIGTNDILQGRTHGIGTRYAEILHRIPNNIPIVLVSPPPISRTTFGREAINPRASATVRQAAFDACAAVSRCTFVDPTGAMSEGDAPLNGVLLADGIHLSPLGYQILIPLISAALKNN